MTPPKCSQAAPLIPLPEGCLIGRFIRRVKRFSVEFEYQGERLWAHSNNSGTMLGLLRTGYPVLVSPAANPARKLPYTVEMINVGVVTKKTPSPENIPHNQWVGVNTLIPNRLLKAGFRAGALPFAADYAEFKAEAVFEESRIDGLFTAPGKPSLWVECKNVTLVEDCVAAFPDAVTERGQKHVRALMRLVEQGQRAAFFYCVQRTDASCFGPAGYIDPAYAELFYASHAAGVEAFPLTILASPLGYSLGPQLPLAPMLQ